MHARPSLGNIRAIPRDVPWRGVPLTRLVAATTVIQGVLDNLRKHVEETTQQAQVGEHSHKSNKAFIWDEEKATLGLGLESWAETFFTVMTMMMVTVTT